MYIQPALAIISNSLFAINGIYESGSNDKEDYNAASISHLDILPVVRTYICMCISNKKKVYSFIGRNSMLIAKHWSTALQL